jgi:acyl-coenzyme A synthetase/AMP-(fatty) acid ligase
MLGEPEATSGRITASVRHHLLADAVLRHLESGAESRPAIHSGETTISYGRLAHAIARGAAELEEEVRPGSRILIASRDQREVAIAFLAALASRSIPLLADPLSRERLLELARSWGVAAAVGEPALFADAGVPVLGSERIARWWEPSSEPLRVPTVRRREAAFWTFTSGTSGAPRAVVHCHEGPSAAYRGFGFDVVGLRERDVVASTAGLPFVYALGNALLFPLMSGASTILAADLLLPTVIGEICRHRATVLVSGPWSLEAMTRLVRRPDWQHGIEGLERVLSAGEPLPRALFERWRETFGHEVLDNLGCTEMFNSFLSNRGDDARAGSLGRPVDGYEVQVGGAAPRPGARGALRVRGRSRAIAISAPGESRLEPPRGAWHETGDEVAVDAGGRFVFLGRRDDRFKVKGQFVHPLEVERVLLEVAGVRECLVVPELDEHDLTVIAARIVPEDGVDPEALKRAIRLQVRSLPPGHRRPLAISLVEALPRNGRGKLERPRRAAS